jgi:hypothetical protein
MNARAKSITVSEDRLAEIIREAVREPVREAVRAELFEAGLMLHEPEHKLAARDDFSFLRSMRKRFDTVSGWIGKAIVTALLAGVLAVIVAGIRAFGVKLGD